MLCACCNRVVHPEFAEDHNYCQVCWSAQCSGIHSNHDETKLKVHHDE